MKMTCRSPSFVKLSVISWLTVTGLLTENLWSRATSALKFGIDGLCALFSNSILKKLLRVLPPLETIPGQKRVVRHAMLKSGGLHSHLS